MESMGAAENTRTGGVIRRLLARRVLVAVALLLALLAGLSTRYEFHDGLTARTSVSGDGSVQVLVDTRRSALTSLSLSTELTDEDLDVRAPLFAEFAASDAAIPYISHSAGVPPKLLTVTADTTETTGPGGAVISTSYNVSPDSRQTSYEVTLAANNELPIITIASVAPTAAAAARLAGATFTGLQDAVRHVEQTGGNAGAVAHSPADAATLRELGAPTGFRVESKPSLAKCLAVAIATLLILSLLLLCLDSLAERRRQFRGAITLTSGFDSASSTSEPDE
jgi:hypothetical protein